MINLEEELKKSYTFEEVFNISDFFSLPASTLYKELRNLKQDQYDDSYRIVFKCFDSPNQTSVKDFFVYLYKTLGFLDIPTFFVLLATNDTDITQIAVETAKDHSTDLPIHTNLYELTENKYDGEYTAILNPPESICVLPWISVEITSNGRYKPCCYYDGGLKQENGEYYHLDTHTYSEVYNGHGMKTLREKFKNGVKPDNCKRCWQSEDLKNSSVRTNIKYQKNIEEFSYVANWEEESTKNLKITGIALGNLCNLKCRICGPGASSRIAEEILSTVPDKKSHPVYKELKSTRWIKKEDHTFWSDLTDDELDLRFFSIAGGEPFMSPHHNDSLQKFVEQDRADKISLRYNTNGTIFNENFVNLWRPFKSVEIALSVDDLGDRIEYQRHGVVWKDLEKNVDKFLNLKSNNIRIELQTAISIQNIFYLPELLTWIKSKNFDSAHLSSVFNPSFLEVSNITAQAQSVILNKLTKYHVTDRYIDSFMPKFIDIVKNARLSDGKEFCVEMKKLDSLRGESFYKIAPEIANAMGY